MPRKPDLKVLHRIVHFFTPNYHLLNGRKVFAVLFGLSLFLRLPFFFRDYIDRDESTFILVAQSWVDGFLPYTQLWDLKPPLTFLFFAIIIKIFGKSLFVIRLIGTLTVASTAFFTYKIGDAVSTKKVGFWSAIGCVALQSMFGNIQGVMSEHISLLPFCIALYLILSRKKGGWYFVSGLLIGVSIMSKLNMVYPAFFLGLFLLYESIRDKSLKKELPNLFLWVLGMILLILITAIPYYAAKSINVWWQSIFMASLAYSSSKINSVFKVLPFCMILFLILFLLFRFKLVNIKTRSVQLLLAVIIGIVVSFIQVGKVNGHYLIQLYPFLLLLIAIGLNTLKFRKKFRVTQLLLFISILLPLEAYSEYVKIVKNKIEKGTFYNGAGFTIPQFLLKNKIKTKNIFFIEHHIGYWVLGKNPPTKVVTHPSNITREEFFPYMENQRKTSNKELLYILNDLQPEVIVVKKNRSIFHKEFTELNEYITTYLLNHYTEIAIIDKAVVYQRLK
jgi:hypothetical protein